MLSPGTTIRSKFLDEDGKYINGTIKIVQEESSMLAKGYFIKFDDVPFVLFLNEKAVSELYDIVDEKIDESLYQIDDNGQINFGGIVW